MGHFLQAMNQMSIAATELEQANADKWGGLKAMDELLEGTYKSKISKAISEASKNNRKSKRPTKASNQVSSARDVENTESGSRGQSFDSQWKMIKMNHTSSRAICVEKSTQTEDDTPADPRKRESPSRLQRPPKNLGGSSKTAGLDVSPGLFNYQGR